MRAGRLVVSNASPPSITIYASADNRRTENPPVRNHLAAQYTALSVPDQIFVDTN